MAKVLESDHSYLDSVWSVTSKAPLDFAFKSLTSEGKLKS